MTTVTTKDGTEVSGFQWDGRSSTTAEDYRRAAAFEVVWVGWAIKDAVPNPPDSR
jgi:hypothetical protein